MKAYKIVIFIFCILMGLAALCWFFPEGINLGQTHLKWTSLQEVMNFGNAPKDTVPAQPELSPEELIAQEMEAVYKAKETEFEQFCATNPIRIHMPDSDETYLDPLFMALDKASENHVRIIHYGDSQLEEDRITSSLREHLQERFGGCGAGLFYMVRRVPRLTINQSTSPESLPYYMNYGPSSGRARHNRYGPAGFYTHVSGNAKTHFTPRSTSPFEHCKTCERVTILASGSGKLSVTTPDSTYVLTATEVPMMVDSVLIDSLLAQQTLADSLRCDSLLALQQADIENDTRMYSVDLKTPASDVYVNISGNWDVYAILLDGKKGVSMDNVPMRGYDGSTFSRIDQKTMRPFYNQQNVQLIILQFGGNSVPYLKSDKAIETFKNNIGKQIDYFKTVAPGSRIMLIGPSDMTTRVNGEMQTYPKIPDIVEALRQAANEHGAAFWSIYDAMGGWNSMIQWVKARPQLAGEDYIHFTHKGAEKMADLLDEVLMTYYKYYRLRYRLDPLENEDETQPTDSLSVVSDSLPANQDSLPTIQGSFPINHDSLSSK